MEQKELRQREMKTNPSINQQEQLKENVKTNRKNGASVGVEEQELTRRNLWKQLKRILIPIFDGNRSIYKSWKAAFTTCIDQAPSTPE